jgi:hypothetical protein
LLDFWIASAVGQPFNRDVQNILRRLILNLVVLWPATLDNEHFFFERLSQLSETAVVTRLMWDLHAMSPQVFARNDHQEQRLIPAYRVLAPLMGGSSWRFHAISIPCRGAQGLFQFKPLLPPTINRLARPVPSPDGTAGEWAATAQPPFTFVDLRRNLGGTKLYHIGLSGAELWFSIHEDDWDVDRETDEDSTRLGDLVKQSRNWKVALITPGRAICLPSGFLYARISFTLSIGFTIQLCDPSDLQASFERLSRDVRSTSAQDVFGISTLQSIIRGWQDVANLLGPKRAEVDGLTRQVRKLILKHHKRVPLPGPLRKRKKQPAAGRRKKVEEKGEGGLIDDEGEASQESESSEKGDDAGERACKSEEKPLYDPSQFHPVSFPASEWGQILSTS